ncbi:MAG: transcriptional repressor [Bacteroidales bacterium]|nr:transcriptional repressor [Bacteroidales bacterium]
MNASINNIRNKIAEKGLKVTPQRMSILEAIYNLENHPTVEQIIEFIRKKHPNIATGTVYKVLDTLVSNDLVKKVKTEKDIMRYDGLIENHHHLYCVVCDHIEDYMNAELDEILKRFFEENKIDNFIIEDIKLQINGRFIIHKNVNR